MLIVEQAKASAARHGIRVCHGRPNPATGDCVFEASIFNVNDRDCFKEKFTNTIDYYRIKWMSEGEKVLFSSPFNSGYSISEWKAGFDKLKKTNVYEVNYFGDMVIPSIACGIKKILLIFNTNTEFPRDPVVVVNPANFGVQPTSEIPLVLAYNLVHYESLHPVSNEDDKKCVSLVKEIISGTYRFTYKDLRNLVDLENVPISHSDRSENDLMTKKRKISELTKDELREYC